MTEGNYTLTLSESQARLISEALELYSRLGMGQIKEVAGLPGMPSPRQAANLEEAVDLLKKTLFPNLNQGSYKGILSPDIHPSYKEAYDMHQVIRHRLAWDTNPKGGIQVWFDEPRQTASIPLIKIGLISKHEPEAEKIPGSCENRPSSRRMSHGKRA